jgi:hypothetical protein
MLGIGSGIDPFPVRELLEDPGSSRVTYISTLFGIGGHASQPPAKLVVKQFVEDDTSGALPQPGTGGIG